MRSGLFWKMFLLQLLAATAVLAGALAVSRTYSVRGFAEYVAARERVRVQEVASEVEQSYRQSGDLAAAFDWVAVTHEHWREAPPREHEHQAPGPGRRRHRDGPMPPLQLQDGTGAYLGGDRHPVPEERLREPLTVDGQIVGYLAWPQAPMPEQLEFAHKQARHLSVIAPVALVIAALCAALITGLIVRPIRKLSAGTAALTRREFSTRLPEDRRDELGALAADFNRLAAALEGYEARQGQWLADIAHELRTPLAVLRGECDALIEGIRTFGPNTVQSLSEEVRRLEALINDLHLVSLAESGGLRLTRTATDVSALVEQAAARFRERFRRQQFELKLAVEPGLVAECDAQRLEQVLANLIENALRHATPPGPLTLSARGEAEHIEIRVADTGPGVPPAALPRLFDRLYRVESARTRAAGGAGLGLAICKSIVEAHGGTIEAATSAAGGLEIVFRLPRHPLPARFASHLPPQGGRDKT